MNTPDTEVTTGDPQTSHASAVIKYPTPDTEWERIVGKFWESEVPVEDEYGGDKAGWLKNSPIAKFMLKTLSSRDTYWKERVQKEVEGMPNATRDECYNEKVICADELLQAIDNLK